MLMKSNVRPWDYLYRAFLWFALANDQMKILYIPLYEIHFEYQQQLNKTGAAIFTSCSSNHEFHFANNAMVLEYI